MKLEALKNILSRRQSEWHHVVFPRRKMNLFKYLLGVFIFVLTAFCGMVSNAIPPLIINIPVVYRSVSFNGFVNLIIITFWTVSIYKSIRLYFNFVKNPKSWIANNLAYMIDTLKLYDEEYFESIKNDKVVREKRIVRVIRIQYRETSRHVVVRILRDGDRFTKEATKLGENLEAALGLELDSTNKSVDYAEYVFLKHKDERIDLNSTVTNVNDSDEIKITGNISYELHKVPHSLIVGGTGSGKSFFILGKIVNYLKLTPQADLRIIDPKKADLSLFRFITGFENKVATDANQICRILRETVELMERRYTEYFNDISAFGKTYRDFNLPVVIVIFDEFSAFMHSVDKKIAKEALDYVFTLVMKGRQAGVMIEILMQRPSADDLPTNIRAQMGFKAGLGAMDSIGYNMIFDTKDVEYKTVTEKGGGYIQLDGKHTSPVYFETPYIDKDFDFIAEIEKLMIQRAN
ncbi:FtsK/SpoIIIE domain-containing protein [Bacillus altitudinis]|nr:MULTISPECIES: FtsK/SpoIIIE domain-containing protein [Bacillus]MCY7622032.1 cell division protein FtsK [Bacillus altitudinis]MED0852387.1 FtsK/SpoIIIE domain-containing protein [Bacillus altitudinis]WEZ69890.1 FtsK/SpoIIIE domain-containing protein [Bacillus altitudinis]SFX69468.1 FtsK/SpoIIIE family protein [Bacillus altitudinis]